LFGLASGSSNAYEEAMQRSLVMTVIGEDRPGLVESVASLVTEHSGNWLESRMSRLGGQFAGIVHVDVPADKEKSLTTALLNLAGRGLNVVVKAENAQPLPAAQPLSLLEIVGQDRPGIVRQISQALAGFNVNVEELNTECASAAMSGESLFKARAKLNIPASCNVGELRRTLEKIAADLIVDISLEPAK
jgi:glycine cleavage system regulatory protein